MDLDTPVGSLSKKSRRENDADASEGEEPASSPVTPPLPPPRSSSPPEDVKEVTTGVKEIELDQKPDVPLSDPSETVESSTILATETPTEVDEEVKTDTEEDPILEQRSEEGNTLQVEGSQDPVKGDSTDKTLVTPEPTENSEDTDTTRTPEEGAKPLIIDPASPAKVPQSKSTVKELVVSEDRPEVKA